MSEVPCCCHLLDQTVHYGTLIDLDSERLKLYTIHELEPLQLPLDQLSHLYYQKPVNHAEPFELEIRFANGNQLLTKSLGLEQDESGSHFFHVGQPSTSVHLFIPHQSPHHVRHSPRQSTHQEEQEQEHQIISHVKQLFEEAIRKRASDLHLKPVGQRVEARFRIDGEMMLAQTIPAEAYPAIVSRIKILGDMDIAEHHQPQDGSHRFPFEDRQVDLRISTIPLLEGESVSIRILDPTTGLRTMRQIGFRKDDEVLFCQMLQRKNGLILVTGPTGSGKSTTLYAAMRELRKRQLNIISLENPVEYRLDHVRQIEINERTGNSFAKNLRHVLRHDPDVILIGEIRDEETARIALQSAYTGHLVLSTLHTNDAPSTIPRLLEMGMESFTLKDTLIGVLSQRLIRKVCPDCHNQSGRVHSCTTCSGSGHHGRMPLYELMPMNNEIREQIHNGVTADSIRRLALESGMVTMEQYAQTLAEQVEPPKQTPQDER